MPRILALGFACWLVSAGLSSEKNRLPTRINSIGMEFVEIPAGTFRMGTPFTETGRSSDESPHEITLSRPFYLGVYEVGQAEYRKVMGANPSQFTRAHYPDLQDTDRFPVEQVSWDDAQVFCEKLAALPAEKQAGRTYRLPTEAEWEYACRAGEAGAFHLGPSLGQGDANFHSQFPYGSGKAGPPLQRTRTVGHYQPNAFGLYDMHGNVWEWVADRYDRDFYLNSPAKDPVGPRNPERRVIRGGSWRNEAVRCRSGFRGKLLPDVRSDTVGLRVVMVEPVPEDR